MASAFKSRLPGASSRVAALLSVLRFGGRGFGRDLHGNDRDLAAGETLGDGFEPRAVLIELARAARGAPEGRQT